VHPISIYVLFLLLVIVIVFFFVFRRYELQFFNVLAFSTYDFHLLRSRMQLIQFLIFNFFISFLASSSHLFFGLSCVRIDIGFHVYTFFLPFSLPAFGVNGQTRVIVVLLCDLLHSYVLLIHLIHHLSSFFMYHLFILQDQRSFLTSVPYLGLVIPLS